VFHVKQAEDAQVVLEMARRLAVYLSPEQAGSLVRFETLLRERAIPAGFIAASDLPRLRERHILDCLRAAQVVDPDDRTAFDLGSGAGLPGLVVAICVPSLVVTLVESRRRRASFLEFAVAELGLTNAVVSPTRIQELQGQADLAFARALAPLPEAWSLARRLLRPGGRLIFFAGQRTEVPPALVGASTIEVRSPTVLESAGPLVIMAR
jgi:16S rRNA (guanine527-N7)-methyltransferase